MRKALVGFFLGLCLVAALAQESQQIRAGIVATACTNQFIRSIAANTGVGTCASIAAGDMPALTGDTTSSAGSLATTTVAINGVNQTTAWTSYTPTATCSTSGTITTDTISGRYKLIGKTMVFEISLLITTLGTCLGNVSLSIGTGTVAANTTVSGLNATTSTVTPTLAVSGGTVVQLLFVTAPVANQYLLGGVLELQ